MTLPSGTAAARETPSEPGALDARIMIVDDEPVVVKVLRRYLRDAGYVNFSTTSAPTEIVGLVRRERPDVILLDYLMPDIDGLQVLMALRGFLEHTPVLMLTASSDASIKLAALELGVTDFLAKPVDPTELVVRIRNALVVKAHHDTLVGYSQRLETEVKARTAELAQSRTEVIHCLARAAEYRDSDTGYHVIRVGRYARIIARELGFDERSAEELELAAQLHDIGKIGIPDMILGKSDALDQGEISVMQGHCAIGRNIIRPRPEATAEWNDAAPMVSPPARAGSPILEMAARIALTHHERWDGSGYPLGLAGEDIPIEGRITAVADVFDALSARRPYKPAFPREQCFELLAEGRGTQFDPAVLDAFQARVQDIVDVQIRYAELTESRSVT